MIIPTVSEVAALHEKLIAATGGLSGVRDAGLLESAVMNCCQSFGNAELQPKRTISGKKSNLICKVQQKERLRRIFAAQVFKHMS